MKIILAPNAFKECLSAPDVAAAMAEGVRCACPEAEMLQIPLADGGDGTMEALVSACGGRMVDLRVNDPRMRLVDVQYGLLNDRTAVIEMAIASGLWRLPDSEKNPLQTTTFGTGEMIRDALDRGIRDLIIGIGGSATTDAGIGMAAALGYRFFDARGRDLPPVGASMNAVARIGASSVHPLLKQARIFVASDVTNPLLGPEGAAPVYGPQKGATPEMIPVLEAGLAQVAERWKEDFGIVIGDHPGGGAAGGLGAGLVAFCGAQIRSGFDLIAEYAGLDKAMDRASLVITGEGRMDASTVFGKVPAGVVRHASAKKVPVIGLFGALDGDVNRMVQQGMLACFSITPKPVTLAESMERAAEFLRQTTEQVMRVWRVRS